MGAESMETYNREILIGGCEDVTVRGMAAENGYRAWHYDPTYQGDESNHYPGAIPTDDIMRRLLSWDIVEVPLRLDHIVVSGEDIHHIQVDDQTRKVLVRSDTMKVLHVVGADYHTPNYAVDVLDFGRQVVSDSDGEIYVASAGLLRGGGQFWMQFMCPEVRVAAGMVFQPFVTISDSCSGKHWEIVRGGQAVVCDNTLTLAMSQRVNHARVRHTKNAPTRYAEAAAMTGIITEFSEEFTRRLEILADRVITDAQWEKFLSVHFGEPIKGNKKSETFNAKNREHLTGLYMSDPMVAPWKGTALGVVQAVNTDRKHHTKLVGRGSKTDPMVRHYGDVLNGTYSDLDAKTIAEINMVFKDARAKQLVFA